MGTHIGESIRRIRRAKDYSQEFVAEKVGITPAYVSRIENGKNDPDSELIMKFARALGVDPGELFHDDLIASAQTKERVVDYETQKSKRPPPSQIGRGAGGAGKSPIATQNNSGSYRIVATAPAGRGGVTDRTESFEFGRFDYDPETHFILEISELNGDSMIPLLHPGDTVLFSTKERPRDGDIVVATWNNQEGAVKFYAETGGMVALKSVNFSYKDIVLAKQRVTAYPVILIHKRRKP